MLNVVGIFSLRNFLLVGVFLFLTGMFYLPGWSAYKIALHLFLFIPALLLFFTDKGLRTAIKQSREFWLFIVFIGVAILSAARPENVDFLVESKRQLFIVLFGLGVVACEYCRPGSLRLLLIIGTVIAAISAVYALYLYYFVGERPYTSRLEGYGLLEHPILSSFVYGIFMVAGLAIYLDSPRGKRLKLLLALSVLLLGLYLFATHTRSAILALAAYLLFVSVLKRDRLIIIYIAVFSLCILLVLYFNTHLLLGRGLSSRPELWASGVKVAMQHFIFGAGVGVDYKLILNNGAVYDHPHNMYVQIFMDLGMVGVLLWIGLIAMVVVKLFQCRVQTKYLALGLIVYACVAVMFDGDGPFVRPRAVWFVSWLPLMFALAWIITGKVSDEKQTTTGTYLKNTSDR